MQNSRKGNQTLQWPNHHKKAKFCYRAYLLANRKQINTGQSSDRQMLRKRVTDRIFDSLTTVGNVSTKKTFSASLWESDQHKIHIYVSPLWIYLVLCNIHHEYCILVCVCARARVYDNWLLICCRYRAVTVRSCYLSTHVITGPLSIRSVRTLHQVSTNQNLTIYCQTSPGGANVFISSVLFTLNR